MSEGPREWSPRGTAWVVLMDSDGNIELEIFKTEIGAYRFAVNQIAQNLLEEMRKDDASAFRIAQKQGHLDEAMEVYDEVMGEYGYDHKLTIYSILKKEILR